MIAIATETGTTADPEVSQPRRSRERVPLLAMRDASGVLEARQTHDGVRAASALADADLEVRQGEIMAVLGESDSGDAALARLAAGLRPLARGTRWWRGRDVTDRTTRDARAARLAIQPIFRDRGGGLDPRQRVVDAIAEAPVAQRIIGPMQQVEYAALQLNRVGMHPMVMREFPQALPTGQRLRIALARALAVRPELLVWEDAFGLLDVTERAQLVNVALDVRAALELAYLLVSRDPALVAHVSDRVTVLYRGRVVESGPTSEVLAAPAHPYTRLLAGTAPGTRERMLPPAPDAPAPAGNAGCAFAPRCPHALPECSTIRPVLIEIAPGRRVACHLHAAV